MLKKIILGLIALAGVCLVTSCVTIARGPQAEALVESLPRDVEWGWRSAPVGSPFDEAAFHSFDTFNPMEAVQASGLISAAATVDGTKQVVADLVLLGKKSYLAFPAATPGTKDLIYVEVQVVPSIVQYLPGSGSPGSVISSRAVPNYAGEQLLLLDVPGRSVSIRSKVISGLLDQVTLRFPGKKVNLSVAYFNPQGTRFEPLGVPLKVISLSIANEVNWYYVLRREARVTVDVRKDAGNGSVRVFYPSGQPGLKTLGEAEFLESNVAKMREQGAFAGLNVSDTPLP